MQVQTLIKYLGKDFVEKGKAFSKIFLYGWALHRFTTLPLFRYIALMRKSPCIPIGIVEYIGLSSDDGLHW